MRLLKTIYEKTHNEPAPYYYNYSLKTALFKPIRKWLTNSVAANCPFNCIRIAIYRMCGFKIGKNTFIGMKCYLDDMCYDLLKIGDNVTISYGVYFACHGKGQGHLPIIIGDGVYVGMRACIISKNAKNTGGGGYIYTLVQRSEHVRWSIKIFQKIQRLLEYHAELFSLQTVQM